jgi:hypothetical protein
MAPEPIGIPQNAAENGGPRQLFPSARDVFCWALEMTGKMANPPESNRL